MAWICRKAQSYPDTTIFKTKVKVSVFVGASSQRLVLYIPKLLFRILKVGKLGKVSFME